MKSLYELANNYHNFLKRKFEGASYSQDPRVHAGGGLNLNLTDVKGDEISGYEFHGLFKGVDLTFRFKSAKKGRTKHSYAMKVSDKKTRHEVSRVIPQGDLSRAIKKSRAAQTDLEHGVMYEVSCNIDVPLASVSEPTNISVQLFEYLFRKPFGIATGLIKPGSKQ